MRALVTGSEGFIGGYLCGELEGHGYEVIRCDVKEAEDCEKLDITDAEAVKESLERLAPDVIFNLAGQANVGLS